MFEMTRLGMIVNAIGAGAVLIVGTYAANSFFSETKSPPCGGRYPAATELSLRNGENQSISPIELQARFGQSERGILQNVDVIPSAKAPSPEVLQVKLFNGPQAASNPEAALAGAAFEWLPTEMKTQNAACLTYSVLLPKTFKYADGGVLPGLFGGDRFEPGEGATKKKGIVSLVRWTKEGSLGIMARVAQNNGGRWYTFDADYLIPRGRWTAVQMEVVLNAPGKTDGMLRLWVDGMLRFEKDNIAWRDSNEFSIQGVAADFTYLKASPESLEGKSQAVRLSPFSIRWEEVFPAS